MTDGRIPGKWVSEPRFAEMPDATFGFLARALAWSNEAGTDGHVKDRYLASLHSSGEKQPQAYAALEAASLWKRTPDGYQFINWDLPAHRGGLGQSLASTVQAGKQRNKDKQQRFRDRTNPTVPSEEESRNPVTLPGYVGHDTTRHDRLITGEVSENETTSDSSVSFAPCCGEEHGSLDPCPIDLFRESEKKTSVTQVKPDFGYCPPPCGRSLTATGVCPKGH